VNVTNVEKLIFDMRHRVIVPADAGIENGGIGNGDRGAVAARQTDAVLMSAGFKCSAELLDALGRRSPEAVIDLGVQVTGWARELVGDHVQHNAYFIDFPRNVPDTVEFWLDCIRDAMAGHPLGELAPGSVVNLLSLPKYGRYQHAYEEMLARHDELIPALSDRITVLHRGESVTEEASALYRELAGSSVPLSGQALDALRFLAAYHGGAIATGTAPTGTAPTGTAPTEITIRENKAIVNAARIRNGLAPSVDTPTDVLRIAAELSGGEAAEAASLLAAVPGQLWRSADYLLRSVPAVATLGRPVNASDILGHFSATAPRVSGRVLLSVREHLQNRTVARPGSSRIFVNRQGRAWVTGDRRDPLDAGLVARMLALIDAEVESRLPDPGRLLIDPAIEAVALPLSGKAAPAGLRVYPRGSVTPVNGDLLRFFVYWKQASRTTDFDLSAIITDEQFGNEAWVSYTNLRTVGGEHSGDITEASEGATEFINIDLDQVGRSYVLPQVYVYSGEGFDDVTENFFGFMTLSEGQRGAPFEPRTVRMRSALTGDGRTAMPLVFYRGEDGQWYAKWLHLYLRGRQIAWGGGVRVEENRLTSRLLTSSMMERDHLRVGYLTGLLRRKASGDASSDGPVTYIGVEQPEDLPENSTVYTLANLASLIPT
jgi:hypothetical protein